jgi:diguanylate cyclase (GGDEF)-like protein
MNKGIIMIFIVLASIFLFMFLAKFSAQKLGSQINKDKIEKSQGNFMIRKSKEKKLKENYLMATQELEHLTYYDTLTGIPNKRHFQENFSNNLIKANENGTMFAVLIIDIDKYKWVNHTMGHDVGDELIKQFVKRVRGCITEKDSISRLGGDDFVVILNDISAKEEVIFMAEYLLSTLEKPWMIQNHKFATTSSIGISIYPLDGSDYRSLVTNANYALSFAKDRGQNIYSFFHKEIEKKISRMLLLERELKNGLENHYFNLVYQPQINLFTGEAECIEILLRFDHPLLGSVSPQEFIPICEKTGIINDLTAWIIEQAGTQYSKWIAKGITPIKFAINFSPFTLKDDRFVEKIMQLISENHLPAQYLEFEVTENALLEDFAAIRNNLLRLKDIGVRIALDDFGAGYSSFLYFKNLPIDKVKIDKEFVQGITDEYGKKDQAIINTIISLAKEIDIDVVCEGVETSEQADYLMKAQCQYAQGYLFYKPLTAEELEEKKILHTHSLIP